MSSTPKVLVKENVGESGIDTLRSAGFEVELGFDWADGDLERRLGEFDGILIRSATKLTADVLQHSGDLKVIGRAGVGVDNVDVPVASKRGIVVVNAPQSNVVTAAEHTVALLLAVARNIPQAHASLTSGKWERSKFSGVELQGKTLGVLGFGRIGQLVAERAAGFGVKVLAYDPFVSAERFREAGVSHATTPEEVFANADFITIHLPKTPETLGFLGDEAFAQMKDGVIVLNVARGGLIDEEELGRALDSGKVGGAGLDVFPTEPVTEHALFGNPKVVVTPHLGASTAEATDRAGQQAAEQIVLALTSGAVTSAINVPAVSAEDLSTLGPFVPLSERLGRLAVSLSEGPSIDELSSEFLGRIADRDTRPLSLGVLVGALSGNTEEHVNQVSASSVAEERGISLSTSTNSRARDFADIVRVSVRSGDTTTRVAGTLVGQQQRPHLIEAWGWRFNVQLDDHVTVLRYRDQPGMLGRIGTVFGEAGVNIVSAAVGYRPQDDAADETAVMVVSSDREVPAEALQQLLDSPGFERARSVSF
ncbi:MAG: phosphoglycerate dehydrogenase [Solirubrobacteraceae bacterium]|nr:phosphoglycerate dehydrogenase [Solirubrobacteraceae bacterium]